MDVPLARFLTRFSDEEEIADEPVFEDRVETPVAPIEDPTETAVTAALADAARRYDDKIATLQQEHEAAIEMRLAAERENWCSGEGEKLAQRLDGLMTELRDVLAGKIGDALTPLVGHAVVHRARTALLQGIEAIVSDPDHPALLIRAPGDLLDAVRAANPQTKGIRYVAHDDIDAVVTADGIRIETRLQAVLPTLAELEL